MNRLFKYHAIFTQFLQRPSRIPILAIDARLCLFQPRADEASVPPEQRTGLSECRQSAGAFDHEFTQTPLAKHASFSGSLVAEVSSLCISSVCLITLDFPQPTEIKRAASSHQRGSRNPRPPDPLAFWRRYSAEVASARFASETDFCSFAVLIAAPNEASIWFSSAPRAARNTPRSRCSSAHQ